ncbi:hypothetical protein T484DRAFT_1790830 [Baffinella frigidus]|nr:hypothetical protein T484DRAFT_1790830 [Cryptophyta sp. CCMP2293]
MCPCSAATPSQEQDLHIAPDEERPLKGVQIRFWSDNPSSSPVAVVASPVSHETPKVRGVASRFPSVTTLQGSTAIYQGRSPATPSLNGATPHSRPKFPEIAPPATSAENSPATFPASIFIPQRRFRTTVVAVVTASELARSPTRAETVHHRISSLRAQETESHSASPQRNGNRVATVLISPFQRAAQQSLKDDLCTGTPLPAKGLPPKDERNAATWHAAGGSKQTSGAGEKPVAQDATIAFDVLVRRNMAVRRSQGAALLSQMIL